MKWCTVKLCPDCRSIAAYQVGTVWYGYPTHTENIQFCERCGFLNITAGGSLRTAIWISTSRWFNPFSWRSGYFMLREDYLAQEKIQEKLLLLRKSGR